MQRALLALSLALLAAAAGCNGTTRLNIFDRGTHDKGPDGRQETVTAAMLVDYMNKNAERLKSVKCYDVQLVASKGITKIMSLQLEGKMLAQQPRDFRLTGSLVGKGPAVDLGSNNDEFWYWIRDIGGGQSYQFFCSYNDLQRGSVKPDLPLPPFQPDWIMETLGMSDYGPPTRYELREEGDRIKLIERAKSPRGQDVLKIIVFNRKPATGSTPQVVSYLLVDAKNPKREICSAHVQSVQLTQQNAAKLPLKMILNWPEERVSLSLTLKAPSSNVDVPQTAFVRQPLAGAPSINLATGTVVGQPSSIQRTQGFSQK